MPRTTPPPAQTKREEVVPPAKPKPSAAFPVNLTGEGKRTVALLLRNEELATELAGKLEGDVVEVVTTDTSEELYKLVSQRRVDLLIIEQKLRGFISGLEILERLQRELLCPEVVLLAAPSENVEEQATSLGIDSIVSPDADIDEILQMGRDTLAVLEQPNEAIPHAARKLVRRHDGIPPLPQLLVKLVDYMKMEPTEIPLDELAKNISVDPEATAELLKLINSASIGLQRSIHSVSEAINYLGAKRTVSLILSAATVRTQSKLLSGWTEPMRKWYHQRSVLIASTAATFAERMENISADTAFVLGLLQEIGILILADSTKHRYLEKTVRRAREVPQVLLHTAEMEAFHMTHAEVSAALLQSWSLPDSIIGPILDHHRSANEPSRAKADKKFLRVMQIGEAFANFSDIPHPFRRRRLDDLLAHYGASAVTTGRASLAEATTKTAEFCELLSLPVPDDGSLKQLISEVQSPSGEQSADGDETAANSQHEEFEAITAAGQ